MFSRIMVKASFGYMQSKKTTGWHNNVKNDLNVYKIQFEMWQYNKLQFLCQKTKMLFHKMAMAAILNLSSNVTS